MVLAATPNQPSSGLRRRCSTATIDNDGIGLMLCPFSLCTPTLMGYFYAYNAILQALHTMRRVDVVLAATPNQASSGQTRSCSIAVSSEVYMSRVHFLLYCYYQPFGRLAIDIARFDVATHIKVTKFEATSTLKLTLIRTETRLYHRSSMCSLHEPFQSTSSLSSPTIMGHYRRILLVLMSLPTQIGGKIES